MVGEGRRSRANSGHVGPLAVALPALVACLGLCRGGRRVGPQGVRQRPLAADAANRALFEKECAALIAPGGPCADVQKGGGGRRGCVAKPENLDKASPACKKVIEEWKALPK